ncbi:hypothetical protein [Pseudoalteromonas sp. R3]|nr:hypothetical protein [Pseudoalteromonas sp. R3]
MSQLYYFIKISLLVVFGGRFSGFFSILQSSFKMKRSQQKLA